MFRSLSHRVINSVYLQTKLVYLKIAENTKIQTKIYSKISLHWTLAVPF